MSGIRAQLIKVKVMLCQTVIGLQDILNCSKTWYFKEVNKPKLGRSEMAIHSFLGGFVGWLRGQEA